MKTITMSKNEAAELYNGLVDVKDLKSKNFALKAAKNMTAIKEALQDIEDLGKPTDEFMELSLRVQTIIKEDPDNGKDKIEELRKILPVRFSVEKVDQGPVYMAEKKA